MQKLTLRNDFHGTTATVIPSQLGRLTASQVRRARRALCPLREDCACGGAAGTRGPQRDGCGVAFVLVADGADGSVRVEREFADPPLAALRTRLVDALHSGDEPTAPEPTTGPVALDIWIKDPDGGPYLKKVRNRTRAEIFYDLQARLLALPPDGEDGPVVDEYFSPGWYGDKDVGAQPIPAWRWVACYAVTGGSEGHYVHVDLISEGDRAAGVGWQALRLATGKTFRGMAHAQRIAAICAALLEA